LVEERNERRWLILASTSLGTLLSVINGSIVNVSLPTLAIDLGAGLEEIQWVVLIYLLTISAVLPIMGRLADMIGRKQVYIDGFLLVILGSILCAQAPNLPLLLAARVVQAIGAAMPMANGMAIVTTSFPATERGQALGIVGTMVALGSLLGPTIGGLIVGVLSWEWIFYINIPLGLIAYFTARKLLPDDRPQTTQKQEFDFRGALFFGVAMITLLLALSFGNEWGWTSYRVVGLLLAAMVSLAAFLVNENRAAQPLVDLALFKIKSFSAGLLAATLAFCALSANVILMPFYLQNILGYDPARVGLLMAPYPLVMGLIAPVSGWLSDRLPPALLTTGGLFINAVGLYWLSSLGADATYLEVALHLALLGLGMGLFQSPNNSSIMGSVPRNKLGVANGVNSLVRNVGMVVGTAVMVTILTAVESAHLAAGGEINSAVRTAAFLAGWKSAFTVSAGIALIAAAVSSVRGALPQAVPAEKTAS